MHKPVSLRMGKTNAVPVQEKDDRIIINKYRDASVLRICRKIHER